MSSFVFVYFLLLRRRCFFRVFCTAAVSSLYREYVVHCSRLEGVSTLVPRAGVFYISLLYENSIKFIQSIDQSIVNEKNEKTDRKRVSYFCLTPFSTKMLFYMDHRDLTIANESRRTESALCAISGRAFGNKTVLTDIMSKKPIIPSASVSIDNDQTTLENVSVGHNKDSSTYKNHEILH